MPDTSGRLVATRSSSGVVNAVEPLMRSGSGVWVAEGVGYADRVAARHRDGLTVRNDGQRYRLRRVFLEPGERRGYYDGFANSGLWPLCHRTGVEPIFYASDFRQYELVNRRFADAVCDEAVGATPTIFVQDYHFALAPALIRKQMPLSRIATFWHIPWPRVERFEVCPWSRYLLEGLLGSSLLGFQTAGDRRNFYEAAARIPRTQVDEEAHVIVHRDRRVTAGVYPASIEWPGRWSDMAPVAECRASLQRELGLGDEVAIGVGVDRLDYTKGIEQKFLAIERLLERRPSLVGRLAFVQLAQPTRVSVPIYQHTRSRVLEVATRINQRFGGSGRGPIIVREGQHTQSTIARHFRAADFCYVGSLHDGMNLVSKEFVCARDDERGVLLLSEFAGAATELTDALRINPYDVDACAAAIAAAVTMEPMEQRERMQRMRQVVATADARRWAERIVRDVAGPSPSPSLLASGEAEACDAFIF